MGVSVRDSIVDASARVSATRELRFRLGLSQIAFCQRIKRTLNTVVRYESGIPPKGEALVSYAVVAMDEGWDDLTTVFRDALIQDLGPDCQRVLAQPTILETGINVNPEYRQLVKAFVKFMGARDLTPTEELAREGLKSLLLLNFSGDSEKRSKVSPTVPAQESIGAAARIRAARELRSRLRLKQSSFGQLIGRTVNTVLRNETKSELKREALITYAVLALDSNFHDLAGLFRNALIEDLGSDWLRVLGWMPHRSESVTVPSTLRSLVKAFLRFLADPELGPAEELAKNGVILLLRSFAGTTAAREK